MISLNSSPSLTRLLLQRRKASAKFTVAGGTGNGYMLSQLRGAVNPSGWSGVIEVKNPICGPSVKSPTHKSTSVAIG